MNSRNVTLKLKANSATEFNRLIEHEITPILRKQKGFRDEITFVAPERSEALAISVWDTKEDSDNYTRTGYPEVLKALSNVIEGTPKVETFNLSYSTFHKVAGQGL
jgi:heme-degrading monooxygenase HmoA